MTQNMIAWQKAQNEKIARQLELEEQVRSNKKREAEATRANIIQDAFNKARMKLEAEKLQEQKRATQVQEERQAVEFVRDTLLPFANFGMKGR